MGKVKAKPNPPTEPSSRYRSFLWAVAFLSMAQLLVGLDYITIWPGGEARLIAGQTESWPSSSPVGWLLSVVPLETSYWLLWYRLPGLLLSLVGVILYYRWGRPLFGKETVSLTLLVAAASLFLPVMLKRATLDVWTFGPLLVTYVAVLRYYKEPSTAWRNTIIISGVIAIFIGGLTAVLALVLIWLLLLSLVKGENRLLLSQRLRLPAVVWAISAVLVTLIAMQGPGLMSWDNDFHYPSLSLGHLSFVGWSLFGLLPFIGFALAGFRDLGYKARRNEELSLLLIVGLLASFLVKSLLFPFLLAFLTAKQVQAYFRQPNYPWQNWVKTATVLHLILVFIGVVLSLLGGYASFDMDGFRAILGCSAAYWMFSFLSVIGLYGERRDYVLGGSALAGVVALLFFWVQVYPFLELKRNWPRRLVQQIELSEQPPAKLQYPEHDSTEVLLLALPYLERSGIALIAEDDSEGSAASLQLFDPADTTATAPILLEGWADLWEPIKVGIE